MSVFVARHSQVKYLNQYLRDGHISCISRPGAVIRDLFPMVQEATEVFDMSICSYKYQKINFHLISAFNKQYHFQKHVKKFI